MNIQSLENKKWCLYCHTNKINGKKYFGITCQKPEKRWQNGLGYKTKYFYNAIQKYGWENFDHAVLFTDLTLDEANRLEMQYIKGYHTCIYDDPCHGYNSTFGGDGCVGYKHSDETKEKFKSRIMTQDTKNKISRTVSKTNLGRVVSPETRAKISKSRSGIKHSDIARLKISQSQIGKPKSESWKEKVSKQHIEDPRYNCKKVGQFDKDTGIMINCFFSTGEALRQTGINNISSCCRGVQKTAGGYVWKYVS